MAKKTTYHAARTAPPLSALRKTTYPAGNRKPHYEVPGTADGYTDEATMVDRKVGEYGRFDPLVSVARRRGRAHELCTCPCGWNGKHNQLTASGWRGDRDPKQIRRPDGFCPKCGQRPFWMPLTEAQVAVLAP